MKCHLALNLWLLSSTTDALLITPNKLKWNIHSRVTTSILSPPYQRKPVSSQSSNTLLFSTSSSSSKSKTTNIDDDTPQLGAWIPVGSASSLQSLTPTQIKIMNRDFAVWHDPKTDQWSVSDDACPHRQAPLSQGRVDPSSGCVECPYHGWQFDTEGRNTLIPQYSDTRDEFQRMKSDPQSKIHATSYPVHLAGDLLFAFLPSEVHNESFPRSLLPEQMYPDLLAEIENGKAFYARDLPYSFDILIENFMDPAHIPFAHNGLQAERDDGSPIPMKLLVNNFTMVEADFQDVNKNRTRNGILSFQRPSYYHFRLKKKDAAAAADGEEDYIRALGIYCVPIQAGKSRVIYQNFGPKWFPIWISHIGANRFLNTDTWLHDAERRIVARKETHDSPEKVYVSASSSDVGMVAFRQWWKKHGFADAPPHTFASATVEQLGPTALTRAEQIDPWVYHAKQCSACRDSLAVWKMLEKSSLVFSILSAIILGSAADKPLAGAVLSLLGLGLHFLSKDAMTLFEGNPHASGVDDRSVAASK